ncbi:MAG: SCO2322 family protein, partial [Actinomycetota bacterium]
MKFRAAGVVIAASIIGLTSALPAAASEYYRYWSYWVIADGGWVMADTGPSDQTPADGTVEGWRFSVNGISSTDLPRYSPDFATVCADTPAQDGRKRVALIVDPGEAS